LTAFPAIADAAAPLDFYEDFQVALDGFQEVNKEPVPFFPWIIPALALAYMPLRSRFSHSWMGVATWTSINPPEASMDVRISCLVAL
jgi:hypothetical protein